MSNPHTSTSENITTTERIAKGMTIEELFHAMQDCRDCIALNINPGKYVDQLSVFSREAKRRLEIK